MENKINPERMQLFMNTALVRHRIYVKKELGLPKPWTNSEVFRNYYFCNVFRRLDKTSKWIIQNVHDYYMNTPGLWKKIIMARYISRIDTLQHLWEEGGFENIATAEKILLDWKKTGHKIVTNAFVVNSKTSDGYADKITHLFRTLQYLQDEYPDMEHYLMSANATLQETYNKLLVAPGCGPFMSYQYVCDFAYTPRYLMDAPDEHSWTQLGLGAMRGMNRIIVSNNIRGKVPDALDLAREMLGIWQLVAKKTVSTEIEKLSIDTGHDEFEIKRHYYLFDNLKMCDIQHWLCEFDKYMRGGSKKRRYPGI